MPLFSAFAPFNMMAFSSSPTRAENIYNSMISAKRGAFNLEIGSYQEAKTYAQAMGIARARYALERAQNQLNPFTCIEMLPQLEKDWAVIPSETASILDRQAAVAAKMILARGCRREAVEDGLRHILSSHYISLRNTATAEVQILANSVQNYARPEILPKYIQFTSAVSTLGAAVVQYTTADPYSTPILIVVGDKLTVQPENMGLKEVVTVTAATSTSFTATFTKPHDMSCYATTANYVDWMSTQRELFIVVDAFAAIDAETIRRVNDFMGHVTCGVTDWQIVEPNAPGSTTMGPFTLNVSPLGTTPIGTMNIIP